MKRLFASILTASLIALPAASSFAAPPAHGAPSYTRDEITGANAIVGGTLVGVPTMIWGFVAWAAADSLAAATIGGAVFFGGFGVVAVTAGCALDEPLCGRALNAGHDAVLGMAGRVAGAFDHLVNGSTPSCPLK